MIKTTSTIVVLCPAPDPQLVPENEGGPIKLLLVLPTLGLENGAILLVFLLEFMLLL